MTEQMWDLAASWGTEERMNEIEALMWRSENHPRLSSTICSLMLFDTSPDWDRFLAAHEWATELVPRCRQRVLDPLLPVGPPAWVPDEAFQLDYHVRRTRLPGEGTMAHLLEFAQTQALAPFDRTRPLWEGTLVEGLEGGRAAYLLKLHHSLTDGLGGIQLMSLVQSRTREHTADKPRAEPRASAHPANQLDLTTTVIAENVRRLPGLAGRAVAGGARVLTGRSNALGEAVRYGSSLRRTLSPPPATPSPLLADRRGTAWRFQVMECELADLKAAAKLARGSLNDAYVAALLGGLRRYHQRNGVDIEDLSMVMPVSMRKSDDPMGGNKFAGAYFAAPIGIEDPVERIAVLRGIVLTLRVEPALDTLSLVAPLLNRVPSKVGQIAFNLVGSAAELSASNMPGVPHPVYMAGARVERVFPFGPLPGVAVMAGLISHDGTCCIGLNIDGDAITDLDQFMECMNEGLLEVTSVVG
ncbi:wax ester/triacylglycerol synthase domain-containing protein [Nocardioides allogilvus]|uniref:wax ester/triacylglycerol synthase domain-containing protein n=1 Tax=Nocardioides allogilvus TaxID=2072017 RepID=UPI0013003AA2|nr:wax ester/triacylglycerol synthase domain-containing protein [Nocardioides allogilvus]